MTHRQHILQELQHLKSSLTNDAGQIPYTVPAGYFDELASQMIKRIKASEASDPTEELNYLAPTLFKISKQIPYTVPGGYFETLAENAIQVLRNKENIVSVNEELATLSPLLSSLHKKTPYKVPQGYFDDLSNQTAQPVLETAKVVSIHTKKWFRYAAAAVVTGVIAMSAFLFVKNDKPDATTNSHAWVKKNVKKVSTDKLDEFIELTNEEKLVENAVASADKTKEIKALIKDIPDSEIQTFLNEIEMADYPTSDEMILN